MPRRGAALIKVDQVPNFTAAALDHPVVAVEGRLVAKLLVRARLRGQLVRVPLEAQQPQLLQALWVERLPAQDLSPARRGRAMCAAPVGGVAGRRGRRTMCARSPRCGSPRPSACPPPSARSPSFASRCRTSGRTGTPTRHRRSWESSTRRGRCSAASAAPAPGAAPSTSCTAATKFAKVSAHKRYTLGFLLSTTCQPVAAHSAAFTSVRCDGCFRGSRKSRSSSSRFTRSCSASDDAYPLREICRKRVGSVARAVKSGT